MIDKFMVIVETKNYPINSIRPIIQRYSRIKKRMTASEIAVCLSCYANVTLVKFNDITVKLTKDNFKQILVKYKNELENNMINKQIKAEEKNNTKKIEELVKETKKEKPEPDEEEQSDPENPETFDESKFYEE